MDIAASIESYLYEQDFTEKTRKWYRQKLVEFGEWTALKGMTEPGGITWAVVREFSEWLRDTPSARYGTRRTTQTVHGYMRAVRAYLKWCCSEDLVDARIWNKWKMPRVEEKVIGVFTDSHIHQLLDACREAESEWLTHRNRAIVALLVDTGIRASELLTLTLDNVHLGPDDAYIKVHGKRDKWREVGMGNLSRSYMHRYLARWRPRSESVHVFLSKKFTAPMTPHALDKMIYTLRDRCDEVSGVRCSAHTFRHTFAYNYLKGGGDIAKLMRLMGHTSIQTTMQYLRSFQSRDARSGGESVLDQLMQRRRA